jgi:DNA-binding protein H-NS
LAGQNPIHRTNEQKGIRVSTYQELKKKAEALMQQAEQARQQEIREVIGQIKLKMQEYNLSLQDLRSSGIDDKVMGVTRTASTPKYRGPNGQLWSGGRGRKPDWVLQALKEGKDLEEFAIRAH